MHSFMAGSMPRRIRVLSEPRIINEDENGTLYFACGCIIGSKDIEIEGKMERAFILIACDDPTCQVISFCHEESNRQGKPISHYKKEDVPISWMDV